MPTKKRLGNKAVFKFNGAAIAAIKKFTPPAQKREKVDVTTLDSDLVEYLDSEPIDQGEFSVELYWTPNDSASEAFETLFKNANSDLRVGTFVIEYPFSPKAIDTFSGRLLELTPADLTNKDGISRTVKGVLTSAIVRTAGT